MKLTLQSDLTFAKTTEICKTVHMAVYEILVYIVCLHSHHTNTETHTHIQISFIYRGDIE